MKMFENDVVASQELNLGDGKYANYRVVYGEGAYFLEVIPYEEVCYSDDVKRKIPFFNAVKKEKIFEIEQSVVNDNKVKQILSELVARVQKVE